MTIDAFLSQYRILVERIGNRSARLSRLRSQAETIAAIWGEHRSAHIQDPPYVRMLEEIDTLVREQEEDEEILPYLQAQVQLMISSLPEEDLRKVMEQRYLNGKSSRQIARMFYIDTSTVSRRVCRALSLLTVPDRPVVIPCIL